MEMRLCKQASNPVRPFSSWAVPSPGPMHWPPTHSSSCTPHTQSPSCQAGTRLLWRSRQAEWKCQGIFCQLNLTFKRPCLIFLFVCFILKGWHLEGKLQKGVCPLGSFQLLNKRVAWLSLSLKCFSREGKSISNFAVHLIVLCIRSLFFHLPFCMHIPAFSHFWKLLISSGTERLLLIFWSLDYSVGVRLIHLYSLLRIPSNH